MNLKKLALIAVLSLSSLNALAIEPIDLNTATAAELAQLKGISTMKAKLIIGQVLYSKV